MRGAGVQFFKGDDAEMDKLIALGQPLIDEWKQKAAAMGVDGQAVIDFYRTVLADETAKLKNM